MRDRARAFAAAVAVGVLIGVPALRATPIPLGTGSGGGGNTTFTTSTTHHTTDTRVDLEDVQTFLTRLTASLDGGPLLYDQSALPFSDPLVQAAILDAQQILADAASPDGVAINGPNLVSSGTSSHTDFLGNQLNHTEQRVTTTQSFGPGTILIGDDQSQTFYVRAGTVNFNTNTHTETFMDQLYQKTNTLSQTYDLHGTSEPTAVPEPGTLTLLGLGLVAWRRMRSRT